MDFQEISYKKHQDGYQNVDKETLDKWAKEDSVDYWRHKRMYDTLLPILNTDKDKKWLTVGDGRYGSDAHYLSKHTSSVMATDIAETCLRLAKENNYIKSYSIENAEKMSFNNDSFDYVLCKEAYHHFPRPTIALYEMLRVAKTAAILIEPNDNNVIIPQKMSFSASIFWFTQSFKNFIKRKLGKTTYYNQGMYEDVGNYVYTISEREIEKVALGLNYDAVAFKGTNDTYIPGVEDEKLNANSELLNQIKRAIDKENNNVFKGKRNWGLLTAIIFKNMPSDETIKALREAGFSFNILSKNPHL